MSGVAAPATSKMSMTPVAATLSDTSCFTAASTAGEGPPLVGVYLTTLRRTAWKNSTSSRSESISGRALTSATALVNSAHACRKSRFTSSSPPTAPTARCSSVTCAAGARRVQPW